MSLRNTSNSLDYGSLLDDPTGEASQIQLNHDEVSWEYYSGQVFPTLELVQSAERHHGTRAPDACPWIPVQLDAQPRSCLLCSTHRQTKEEAVLLTVLLEKVYDWDQTGLRYSVKQTRVAACTLSWRPPKLAAIGFQRSIDLFSFQQH